MFRFYCWCFIMILDFFLHYAVAAAWQQRESSKIEIHQKIDTYLIDHNEVSPQTKQFWKEAFLWFLSSNSPELLNNLRLNFKILCLLCSILNVIHFNAETVFLPIHPCSVLAAPLPRQPEPYFAPQSLTQHFSSHSSQQMPVNAAQGWYVKDIGWQN